MVFIPTAEESRRIISGQLTPLEQEEMVVADAIKDAISENRTTCYVWGIMSGSIEKKLKNLGYKVETGRFHKGIATFISW